MPTMDTNNLASMMQYLQRQQAQGQYVPSNGAGGMPSKGWDGWGGYTPGGAAPGMMGALGGGGPLGMLAGGVAPSNPGNSSGPWGTGGMTGGHLGPDDSWVPDSGSTSQQVQTGGVQANNGGYGVNLGGSNGSSGGPAPSTSYNPNSYHGPMPTGAVDPNQSMIDHGEGGWLPGGAFSNGSNGLGATPPGMGGGGIPQPLAAGQPGMPGGGVDANGNRSWVGEDANGQGWNATMTSTQAPPGYNPGMDLPGVVNGIQMNNQNVPTGQRGTQQWGNMGSLADIYNMKNNPSSAVGTPYERFVTGGNGNGPMDFNRAAAAGYMRTGGVMGPGKYQAMQANRPMNTRVPNQVHGGIPIGGGGRTGIPPGLQGSLGGVVGAIQSQGGGQGGASTMPYARPGFTGGMPLNPGVPRRPQPYNPGGPGNGAMY
jgi:hypothetical protein